MITYPVMPQPVPRRLVAEGTEKKIPERLLAKLWNERAARQTSLRAEAGKRVRVVYPGRSAGTAGPDFRDSLLEVEGVGLFTGDVELYIRQSDWNSHGRGGDPTYNGVVLHGALEVTSEATRLESGVLAPVVNLKALLEVGSDQDLSPGPRRPDTRIVDTQQLDLWQVLARRGISKPVSMDEAGAALDRAGDRRFLLKSRWLSQRIRADGPDQAFYQALMEGLGYSSTRRPFVELAFRAPYWAVMEAAGQLPPRVRFEVIHRWMAACSGLAGAAPPRRSELPARKIWARR